MRSLKSRLSGVLSGELCKPLPMSFGRGDDLHGFPVIGILFAAVQANHVSSCQISGRGAMRAGTNGNRKSEMCVPATEKNIHQLRNHPTPSHKRRVSQSVVAECAPPKNLYGPLSYLDSEKPKTVDNVVGVLPEET